MQSCLLPLVWLNKWHCKVKKKAPLSIIHDFSKGLDTNVDEVRKALSHKRDKFSCTPLPAIDPLKILLLFKRMPDEDCELLNLYSRPENLMVTTLAVPPVTIRPSSLVSFSNSSNENSITGILREIINTNSKLREHLEDGDPSYKCIDTLWAHLQIKVVEYINSESPSVPESTNRGLVQSLKGKQGWFRGNLSGKRVEYTGRTVISPDPNLKITEVGSTLICCRVALYP